MPVPMIEEQDYRQVLGRFPAAVSVVTTLSDDVPKGMAVNSFTSISLSPPLVGFLAMNTSSTLAAVEERGEFCVNLLSAEQWWICRAFASKVPDRFSSVPWRPSAFTQTPVIDGSPAYVDCTVSDIVALGDHQLVVGRVVDLAAGAEGAALIHHQSEFCFSDPSRHNIDVPRESGPLGSWMSSLATLTGFGA